MSVMFEILQRLEEEQGEVSANFTLEAVPLLAAPPEVEPVRAIRRRGPKRTAASAVRPLPIAPKLPPNTRIDWSRAINAGKASLNFWGEPKLRPGWMTTSCLRGSRPADRAEPSAA